MHLATELEIRTNDGGMVTIDALDTPFIVLYNDKAKGPLTEDDLTLGDLYQDLVFGEIFSIVVPGVEVADDEDEIIGTRDVVVYARFITSIIAVTETVNV